MIILIGGEKGGTGKTTIATNLAVLRTIEKKDVLFIDADPQPNAAYWCQSRDAKGQEPRIMNVQKIGQGLKNEARALKQKFAEIIIDTGGRDAPELRAGLLVADVAIVPLKPSQFDLWTLAKINDLVDEVRQVNEKLRVLIVLNQVPTNPSLSYEIENAKKFFEDPDLDSLTLANSIIHEKVVFRKAALASISVAEAGTDDKAEEELNALYKEIYNDE